MNRKNLLVVVVALICVLTYSCGTDREEARKNAGKCDPYFWDFFTGRCLKNLRSSVRHPHGVFITDDARWHLGTAVGDFTGAWSDVGASNPKRTAIMYKFRDAWGALEGGDSALFVHDVDSLIVMIEDVRDSESP